MAVIQKSTEQCALLIVFAIVCGFLASLVGHESTVAVTSGYHRNQRHLFADRRIVVV